MLNLLLCAQAAVLAASASLTVDFVEPKHFTDAGYSRAMPSDRDLEVVEKDVTRHLQSLADRLLPADASLRIELLDIDLAGRFEPFAIRGGSDVRIVRDIAWPRFKLRYTLTHPDGRVETGEEQVSDMNFLSGVNRYPDGDRLRYEKALLDDWFAKRFGPR